jgi:hypothetical protein
MALQHRAAQISAVWLQWNTWRVPHRAVGTVTCSSSAPQGSSAHRDAAQTLWEQWEQQSKHTVQPLPSSLVVDLTHILTVLYHCTMIAGRSSAATQRHLWSRTSLRTCVSRTPPLSLSGPRHGSMQPAPWWHTLAHDWAHCEYETAWHGM